MAYTLIVKPYKFIGVTGMVKKFYEIRSCYDQRSCIYIGMKCESVKFPELLIYKEMHMFF